MSPLGTYPTDTFLGSSAALVSSSDICFSIVRLQGERQHHHFSEVDSLLPIEVPLLAALILAVDEGERYTLPYPMHQTIFLSGTPNDVLNDETVEESKRWMRAYAKRRKLEDGSADAIHRSPITGGLEYDLVASRSRDAHRNKILDHLESADQVTLRGLSSLIKANMAWEHRELNEAACVSLWISLDSIHSLILAKLRNEGIGKATSQDASNYITSLYDVDFEGSIFENDYYNRIRVIHPDNRFGPEARPQLTADDFYELRHLVVELFHHLITGEPTKPATEPKFQGHAFHFRPL
jgi:hypothetical protein